MAADDRAALCPGAGKSKQKAEGCELCSGPGGTAGDLDRSLGSNQFCTRTHHTRRTFAGNMSCEDDGR